MSEVLTFLSWMRRGLSQSIGTKADVSGLPVTAAATLDITVQAGTDQIIRTFGILGPGSVLGLVAGQVLRCFPSPDSTDHESNLFPWIELRSPELPWMFTGASPNADRLAPWLVLVAVEERKGVRLRTNVSPLPVLEVDDAKRELPPAKDAWAWAHVQAAVEVTDLNAAMTASPGAFTSRLMCPRFLERGKSYLACVVPLFEAGRRAGLDASVDVDGTTLAWTADTSAIELPVYHWWRFKTSKKPGDFEELVKRLMPRPLHASAGTHALDVVHSGSRRLPATGVAVTFVGALCAPERRIPVWPDAQRRAFQNAMWTLLAKAEPEERFDGRQKYEPIRHDPAVAPPRYGSSASGIDDVPPAGARIAATTPRWLSEVNLDPRHRAAAGLGADIVRRNQESLMAAAWDQAQGVDRVRTLLNRTLLACEVGKRAKARLAAMPDGVVVQVTAGAHARLQTPAQKTVRGEVRGSALPDGLVSGAFRRRARAGGPLARSVGGDAQQGETTRRITDRFLRDPASMLAYATLTVPFGTVLAPGDPAVQPGASAQTIDFARMPAPQQTRMTSALQRTTTAAGQRVATRVTTAATAAPKRPKPSGAARTVQRTNAVATARGVLQRRSLAVPVRSVASAFGTTEVATSSLGSGRPADRTADVTALAVRVRNAIDPQRVLAARLRDLVRPATTLGSEPVPADVFITFQIDDPLYRLLVRLDPEFLMPGVGELADESVGLAAVNQSFIEAFLVGANTELARELVWREYPAKLSDTWLRTFWDNAGKEDASGQPVTDVPEIASWKTGSLGTHPSPSLDPSRVLVLVVKGELLRRYPNTLVSAVPAQWVKRDDGSDVREEDEKAQAVFPVFSGSLGPGIIFLGFAFDASLAVPDRIVGQPTRGANDPGWYFAFEQPPTEPCFGLDTAKSDRSAGLKYWKGLTWNDARRAEDDTHVALDALSGERQYDSRGENQWTERWGRSASAMARITLQRPVRMLIHADQMLVMKERDGR
jgi:hypothetical protein